MANYDSLSDSNRQIVTKQGLEALKTELNHLIKVKREEIKERLKAARADGDLSENADYTSAREEQAKNESRIQEIENIIASAIIIEEQKNAKSSKKTIRIGSWVTLVEVNYDEKIIENTQQRLKIVGAIESNPFNNLISNECALALSILKSHVGETVEVKNVSKPYKVKILKIENN